MSNKWKLIGTNALEAYAPESNITNFNEKKKVVQKRKWNNFKLGMKIDRMAVNKPKKSYKKDEEDTEIDE